MGKISVIIPIYNTELYIRDCINSLLEQSYKNIEILLIDDHSNEECRREISRVSRLDDRIKVFHFSERKGLGAARNFGMRQASGQFIYFLDSDDYIPHKTFQLLVENINDHDMIFGRLRSTHFNNATAIILEGLPKVVTFMEDFFDVFKKRVPLMINCLIKKEFIERNQLLFVEDAKVYSDISFAVPALLKAEAVSYLKEAIYFKRKRNDPITNPSLTQLDDGIKIKCFLFIYNLMKDRYKNQEAHDYLDKLLLNYYREHIVPYFKEHEIGPLFEKLVRAVNRVNQDIINQHDFVLRMEVNSLKKGDLVKYERLNDRHHLLRDIKNGLKGRKRFYLLLYKRVFSKLPLKSNVIFLESFLGKSYSDSPKYIYEYMIKNNMKYKYVWSVVDKKNIPGNPIQVKRFSLRYFYYLARAKYWVSNSRLPKTLDKREGNVYLQNWHGTPLKTLVFDMKDIYSADPNYKLNFYNQSRRWDYLNSANAYSSEIFKRAFKFEKEMLEFGYPRNDVLYTKNTKRDIENLKKELGLPLDKKVVLYAPTWRDDEFFGRGRYKFTLKLDLEQMQKRLGDEYIVLLRTHYFIANQLDVSDFKGFVYDFSSYDDIAELYLVSDILITDYSSVFFDYANLKRPILFYTYDLEKYRDKLRGFYIDIENEVPGPLLLNSEEVIQAIEQIDDVQNAYKEKYEEFYDRFCFWDDGHASEKTVRAVFKE